MAEARSKYDTNIAKYSTDWGERKKRQNPDWQKALSPPFLERLASQPKLSENIGEVYFSFAKA